MKINILTSAFKGGFTKEFSNILKTMISNNDNFVFIASDFSVIYKKTDKYFHYFLRQFNNCGISFKKTYVIDDRITKDDALKIVAAADVLWLAGGDTATQFKYLKQYNLIQVLRIREGITIGMSAGSINMAKTAICTLTCKHSELKIYQALGLVDISIEPHFDYENISNELLELSNNYKIYGLCDDGAIIINENETTYLGDVFLIKDGSIKKL